MDLTKEVWHCELYKLQQQSPAPIVVKCCRTWEKRPVQYGDEYHGSIDRAETDSILSKYPTGAFLIRDSQRNVGAFTLVIRFDDSHKSYVLYYNRSTGQHYVGAKFFDSVLELVQDGLIHMYIETRGADVLQRIADAQIYDATPYRARLHTVMQQRQQQQREKQRSLMAAVVHPEEDFNGSCDSGIFNSLRSGSDQSSSSSSSTLTTMATAAKRDGGEPLAVTTLGRPARTRRLEDLDTDSAGFSRDNSPQLSVKTLCSGSTGPNQTPPVAPPRRKSLYCHRASLLVGTAPIATEHSCTRTLTHYEPIFIAVPDHNSSSTVDQTVDVRLLEKAHNFRQHTFVGPQWCDLCAHFMWGLVAQGWRCDDCGLQAHRKCSQRAAADCCPDMKRLRRVFGVELTSLAKMQNRGAVPPLFARLVAALESRDLAAATGIYRVSGNIDVVEDVRTDLDKDADSVDLSKDPRLQDTENLTGLIKLFLRQLPIPLITTELYNSLLAIWKSENTGSMRDSMIRESMTLLNSVHFATLEMFIRHLNKVSRLSHHHKMPSSNLAIVFAPTLICKQQLLTTGSPSSGSNMFDSAEKLMQMIQTDYKWDCAIVQHLIDQSDSVFLPLGPGPRPLTNGGLPPSTTSSSNTTPRLSLQPNPMQLYSTVSDP